MKGVSKKAGIFFLALTVAVTTFSVNPKPAAAFNLGDLGNILGGLLGGGGGGGRGRKGYVDRNALERNREKLINNLYYSTALLNAAYENVRIATDETILNRHAITVDVVAKSAMRTGDAGIQMRNGAEDFQRSADAKRQYLSEALASGDEEKLREIDALIEAANKQRAVSDSIGAVAGLQAVLILKDVFGGGVSLDNMNNLSTFIQTAQEAQSILKARSKLSKMIKSVTKEYRENRGQKDPDKKAIKEAQETMVME